MIFSTAPSSSVACKGFKCCHSFVVIAIALLAVSAVDSTQENLHAAGGDLEAGRQSIETTLIHEKLSLYFDDEEEDDDFDDGEEEEDDDDEGEDIETYLTRQGEAVFQSGSIWDIYWWNDCEIEHHHADAGLPIHNQTVWNMLRSVYGETVDEFANSIRLGPNKSKPSQHTNSSKIDADWGYQVPVDVKIVPGYGRGVFATEKIRKDSIVWKSKNTAKFSSGEDYRRFLKSLPDALACDVIMWAYTRFDVDRKALVCVDLDPGSFVNGCDSPDECNLTPDDNNFWTGCNIAFRAARDILSGEELRLDYGFSAKDIGWVALGLMPPAALYDDADDDEDEEEEEEEEEDEEEDLENEQEEYIE